MDEIVIQEWHDEDQHPIGCLHCTGFRYYTMNVTRCIGEFLRKGGKRPVALIQIDCANGDRVTVQATQRRTWVTHNKAKQGD